MIRKILLVLGSVLLVCVVGGALYVGTRQHLTFDAPYPHVVASNDSAVIERGHYIVRDARGAPRATAIRRSERRTWAAPKRRSIGGFAFDIPPGKFYPRNLTSDAETGTGERVGQRDRARVALRRRSRRARALAVHGDAGPGRRRSRRGRVVSAHAGAGAQRRSAALLQRAGQGREGDGDVAIRSVRHRRRPPSRRAARRWRRGTISSSRSRSAGRATPSAIR